MSIPVLFYIRRPKIRSCTVDPEDLFFLSLTGQPYQILPSLWALRIVERYVMMSVELETMCIDRPSRKL